MITDISFISHFYRKRKAAQISQMRPPKENNLRDLRSFSLYRVFFRKEYFDSGGHHLRNLREMYYDDQIK